MSRSTLPEIRTTALETIVAHARMEQPRECCGLLLGSVREIVEAVPLENVSVDGIRRYEIAPADYFAQVKACRERGDVSVVGAYHSHPRSEPVPSATDLAEGFAHFWFLIAGPVSDDAPLAIRAFRLVDGVFTEDVIRAVRPG